VVAIVYLFPKGSQFKYQFQKGKIWHYDDFIAPFDFAIEKNSNELAVEKNKIVKNKSLYFSYKDSIPRAVEKKFKQKFNESINAEGKSDLLKRGEKFIQQVYSNGFVAQSDNYTLLDSSKNITLRKGNEVQQIPFNKLFTIHTLNDSLQIYFKNYTDDYSEKTKKILKNIVIPNVFYDPVFTEKVLKEQLGGILPTKGFIPKDTPIISKGEVVEGDKFILLQSIKKEYESETWSKSNYIWLVSAYTFLVGLALLMLLFFIKKYRPKVYENNSKVSFLFFNIVLIILVTTVMIRFNVNYLYVIPYAIFPIIIKAFFDARLGLFTYVLTILLVGFIVPNSFEFIFIQIIAGIVTILTVSELNKRANLFISVAQITAIYLAAYFAFSITQEGNASSVNWLNIGLFILNGMIMASIAIPIIFLYEKLFGLVSDESLREFSDSNNKLLRELNEKAPGTFQHSMQVANLAEAAAKEINANALLVRAGALYHDIGKMLNPMYFTENQSTSVNPHDELAPEDSAHIIIDHIIKGIELAKKHHLPDRLIDFIRTHHGTSLVYYFYKKELESNPDAIDKSKFRYPGPIPFSKETAILMIADAAEAASKSLKEPTAIAIDSLIDKIVKGQMENGQFQNAAITFKEIETVKKVVKKKLNNIYHVRIEYPE
jgi:putative nucleotidyltransferase with HDIG domain